MKNLFLSIVLIASALMSKAQPVNSPQPCSDLFFSELTFGKNPNGNIWDLNYAVEIFNPTQSSISLSNYRLVLTNSVGNAVNFNLIGSVPGGGVHVVVNSSADANLQTMAHALFAGLDFETTVILELQHNGITIDKVGQNGQPTAGALDIVQLIQDPYAYLATFHLDLNDYKNVDIRRGMLVTAGNPNFNSATDVIGNWGYFPNVNRTNIGTHLGLCNKPASTDIFGYDKAISTLYSSNLNSTDPLELLCNNQLNGFAFSSGLLKHNQPFIGANDAVICNNGAIPFAEMNWIGGAANPCEENEFTYQANNNPKAKVTSDADVSINLNGGNPITCTLRLESNSPNNDVLIDFARSSHIITVQKWPTAVNDIFKDVEVSIYPNYAYADLTVNSKNVDKYAICDMLGKTISNGVISSNTSIISTSSLPQGIYLIIFTSNKGATYAQKFTKL